METGRAGLRQSSVIAATLRRSQQILGGEARPLRALEATADEWQDARVWARVRWAQSLESKPEVRDGKIEFGPASEAVASKTLAELRPELH
ncbi:MAG: hypothetical protein ABIP94_24720 [Planctomycetota bacterium]